MALHGSKLGLNVEQLSKGLEITRNAVRQHLATLEVAGLVAVGDASLWGRPPAAILLPHRARK